MSSSHNAPYNHPTSENPSQGGHFNEANQNGLKINNAATSPELQNQPFVEPTQLKHRQTLIHHSYDFTHIRERHWIERTTILNEIRVDEQGRETWIARPIETKWVERTQPNCSEVQARTQLPPLIAASTFIVNPTISTKEADQEMHDQILAEPNLDTFLAADLINYLPNEINSEVEDGASVQGVTQHEVHSLHPLQLDFVE